MSARKSVRRRVAVWLYAALAAIVVLAAPSIAQEPPEPASVTARFADWDRTIVRAGRDLNTLKLDAAQIDALAERITDLRAQATEFGEQIEGFAQEARDLRDAFVASTPVGAAASAEVQAQGKELEDRVAQFDGWERQVDLTVARVDQLLDHISTRRLDQLTASLTERGPAPFNPLIWWRAVQETAAMAQLMVISIADEARAWRQPGSEIGDAAFMVLAAAAAAFVVMTILLRLIGRQRWPVLGPTLSGPATSILLIALRRTGPWIAAIVAACMIVPLRDWLPEAPGRAVVVALATAGLIAGIGLSILREALAPATGASLIADPAQRGVVGRVLSVLIVLFAINAALQPLTTTFISANLSSAWTLAWTLAGGLLTLSAARHIGVIMAREHGVDGKFTRLLLLVTPPSVAATSIAASLVGFSRFGDYLFSNALATAAAVFAAWALRTVAHEIVVRTCSAESPAGQMLIRQLGADQPSLRLAQFWLGILLDIAVAVCLPIGLMIVWGTGAQDALLMVQRLVEGVRVGNVTLSLADLIVAMATFTVGVWLTRFIQRVLDRRVFPGTQLDLGVRNSVRSGIGYVGVIIAGTIAIAALGVNLSNLALVAGALSVGVGFGLQNIINNFVSGLILLIERPVKVGDWITVGGKEGLVNRINVRSTEILTNDRASVLIPNADFLSVSVTNWTHKDRGARLHITFQLPETLGAEAGRDLLLACAKAHAGVLSSPPPRVLLEAIGGSYTFELEADVADVTAMREVASDLRFAVDRALRARPA